MSKINAFRAQKGWIEVICGPMFAGKSEELLRRVNLLKYAEVKYLLFKPAIDTRVSGKTIKLRDGRNSDAYIVSKSSQILDIINKQDDNIQVIAIDEIQFFDNEIVDVCNYLADNNYIVLAAGLDSDYTRKPFSSMVELLATAEHITKLKAICTNCGAPASYTERTINKNTGKKQEGQIVVGDSETYTAHCRHCHSTVNNRFKNFVKIKKAKAD